MRSLPAVCLGGLIPVQGRAEPTRLRIRIFSPEWLVHTGDALDKDPWGGNYVLEKPFERIASVIETLVHDICYRVDATGTKAAGCLVELSRQMESVAQGFRDRQKRRERNGR